MATLSLSSQSVARALRDMVALSELYQLNLWSPEREADCLHDLSLMHAAGDLVSISTQLLGRGGDIVLEHRVRFDRADEDAGEPAVPVIERGQVASGRFVVNRRSADPSYVNRLRLNWLSAEDRPRRQSDRVGAGGRGGDFDVARESRRRLVVTQVGQRGFAFAEDARLGARVFLHINDAPAGFAFHPGQAVTAIVVSTAKGLQGRVIRPD